MKRPDLISGGTTFGTNGIELINGKKPLELDDIDRGTVVAAIRQLVNEECDEEKKKAVEEAEILKMPATTAAGRKRSRAEAAVPDADDADSEEDFDAEHEADDGPPNAQALNDDEDEDDDDDDGELTFEWNCDQVRNKIRSFVDNGGMTVTEFKKAIGVNPTPYANFMGMNGPTKGINSGVMRGAYKFFKKRERLGLPMPKKKVKTGTAAAEGGGGGAGGGAGKGKKAPALTDLGDIKLDGEDQDAVPVYETLVFIRTLYPPSWIPSFSPDLS